LRQTANCEWND